METTTVQKQRVELELLIAELRDRDRELNEMVASHQKQLLSWEMDRQMVLNLSQKCSNLQGKVDEVLGKTNLTLLADSGWAKCSRCSGTL